eukprot:3599959-Amphidinium_carterae.1
MNPLVGGRAQGTRLRDPATLRRASGSPSNSTTVTLSQPQPMMAEHVEIQRPAQLQLRYRPIDVISTSADAILHSYMDLVQGTELSTSCSTASSTACP